MPALRPRSRRAAAVTADTAGAARHVAERGDTAIAAIASSLAGEIYGLDTLRAGVEDHDANTTRFVVMAREPILPDPVWPCVTSIVFRVRSVPAALYKALGGFATNGVNITKLESYIVDASFTVAQFYAEIEGHVEHRLVKLALEELAFFSTRTRSSASTPPTPSATAWGHCERQPATATRSLGDSAVRNRG